NHVAYCASKGAVIQITRCMALDHARDNIRVNSVCPGEIHTRMVDDILAQQGGDPAHNLQRLAAGIPMRRLAHPSEVARCVQFLASDLASYVTGTNLSVDGGNDATAGPDPLNLAPRAVSPPRPGDAHRPRAHCHVRRVSRPPCRTRRAPRCRSSLPAWSNCCTTGHSDCAATEC